MGTMRMTGDWDIVGLFTQRLGRELSASRAIALKRIALESEKIAKQHIQRQDLKWSPLNAAYLKRKLAQGMNKKILIRTSTYFQSVTGYVEGDTALAGIKREAKDKDGKSLANIAAVHEYGSKRRNIPARPLWKPTYAEMLGKIRDVEFSAPHIFAIRMRNKYGIR